MKPALCSLIIAILLCHGPHTKAQSTGRVYQFQPFSISSKFSDENVRCLFQGKMGYIWMAVDSEGLCKYDGSHFEIFGHESSDHTSISSNHINDIEEDDTGNLWLATERGLNIFQRQSGHFIKKYADKGLPVNMVYKDPNGTMWAGTEKGLLKFSSDVRGTTYQEITGPLTELMKGAAVTSLIVDNSQNYWIGTRSGLYHYSYKEPKLTRWVHSDSLYTISDNEINSMVEIDPNHLLIGSDNGANIFDKQLKKFSRLECLNCDIFNAGRVGIIDVLVDTKGITWIGTTTYGILTGHLTYKPDITHLRLNTPSGIQGLTSAYITDIYEDQNNQILIATKFGGVFNYDPRSHTFPLFELPPSKAVSDQDQSFIISAAEDQDGYVWIGTRDRGLMRFDAKNVNYLDVPIYQGKYPVRRIETIFCDSKNRIWVGHKKGLNLLSGHTLNSVYFELPKVLAVAEDEDNQIWIGTKEGLFLFDPNSKQAFRHPSRHAYFFQNMDFQITRIVCEENNEYWFGTDNNGLYRYLAQNDSLIHFQHHTGDNRSISGNAVRSIFRDSHDRLWVGTKSSGLNLLDGDGFRYLNELSGLPSNTIFSIQEDDSGLLWIATNNGLSRYRPDKNEYLNFNKRHGLQGNVFEKYASIKLTDGRLFVAGNKGFNLFDPAFIQLKSYNPPLVINLIKANTEIIQKDVFNTDTLYLEHFQNILSFDFTALDYRDINAIQYKYKLTGVDQSWINAGNKNHVTYSNLTHGSFEFCVKSTNADGVWSDEILKVKIFIDEPPWLSWWAKSIYVFLVLGLIYFIYWLASLRAGYLHKLQAKELELGKTNELNQLKLNFFTNISHELRTPLTLIMAPLEKLRKSHHRDHVHSSVSIAYRSARQLMHLTDQLLYFRKVEQSGTHLKVRKSNLQHYIRELALPFQELAESKGINLKVRCDDVDGLAWFDPEKLEKIINNLMINAFKFTPAEHQISLQVTRLQKNNPNKPDELVNAGALALISVSDTGNGIEESKVPYIFDRYYQADGLIKGNGIGLELVKSLVKMHKGIIEVQSKEREGTQFSVFLPVEESAYQPDEIERSPYPPTALSAETDSSTLKYLLHETSQPTNQKDRNSSTLPKLLIVEDNPELLNFLMESLEDDFIIRSAPDGHAAMNVMEEFGPDIVLSDVMMPNVTGLELCRKIRENLATSHILVVLLTAKGMEEHQIDGFESGADAYVVKPFDMDVLKARLKSILKNRNRLVTKVKEGLVFEPNSVSGHKLDIHFLSKIIEIIEQNFTKIDFRVEEFAYDLNLSRSQLFRKMKSLTGQTPSEYLYAFRIKKAITLLETRRLNIAEIAYQTGFSSPNSFTKTFTKHTGISPSRYLSTIAGKK